jgi:hypothetical protein
VGLKIPSVGDCLSSASFFNGLIEFILCRVYEGIGVSAQGDIHMRPNAEGAFDATQLEGHFLFTGRPAARDYMSIKSDRGARTALVRPSFLQSTRDLNWLRFSEGNGLFQFLEQQRFGMALKPS